MSVGTHVTGRNLAAYRQITLGTDLLVLITPELYERVSVMRIATTGTVFRKRAVELSDDRGRDDAGAG